MAASRTGKLCAAWRPSTGTSTDPHSRERLDARHIDDVGDQDPATRAEATAKAVRTRSHGPAMRSWPLGWRWPRVSKAGKTSVCIGRVRPGGGLTMPRARSRARAAHERVAVLRGVSREIAGAGGLVALGWWDQVADRGCTAVSRDGGYVRLGHLHGTWTGDSGGLRPAHQRRDRRHRPSSATWMGTCATRTTTSSRPLRQAPGRRGRQQPRAREAAGGPGAVGRTPTQRLAKDKKTAFRLMSPTATPLGHHAGGATLHAGHRRGTPPRR